MTGHLLRVLFHTTNPLVIVLYTILGVITGCCDGVIVGCLLAPRNAGPRAWQAWLIGIAGSLAVWKLGLL